MASLEGGILPCPPEAPVPMPSFGGRQTPRQCPRSDPNCRTTIDCICEALKNLALVASNDTVLQQLMAANLALTASVTLLMAANKKLADALA